jgi:hypothetical protein
MTIPIPYVHFGVGLLCALASAPLILRCVPMNRAYGFRLPKAFVSADNWYAVNAFGGQLLAAFGAGLVVFSVATRDAAPSPRSLWAVLYLVGPLLPFVALLLAVRRFADRLTG